MKISRLAVQNVRTHSAFQAEFSPGVTLVTGMNGSGKTSLIEALYVALRGSSFKGSDSDILKTNKPWWRIDTLSTDDQKRTIKFDPNKTSGRKQFVIDDRTHYRLPERSKYPVVLFDPDDLRLLNGSPTRRRQFIDRFISQLDPLYGVNLRKYDRALKQRNNLLKQAEASSDDLFVWNVSLSEYGAYIIERRIHFIATLNQQLNKAYKSIADNDDIVSIRYSSEVSANIKHKLLAELESRLPRDQILGYTSIGPHRHDVLFDFNNSPALSVASRGEVRSIVLALKFLEVEIIERITDKLPIIMLDDVFSELDESRQRKLLSATTRHQVIVTTTTYPDTLSDVSHITL